jgi:hypothetical protein
MPDTNQPPFMPPKFSGTIPATKPGGGWNWVTGPWEDGPGTFSNPANSPLLVRYNGQSQTFYISIANPKPPRNFSPSAAPPSMSRIP